MLTAAATNLDQELRATGVGASEVAALIGLDPYRGPLDVYRHKIGEAIDVETYHTQRGRYLEPALRQWACDLIGIPFEPSPTLKHPQHEHVLATPDGVAPGAVLELKAPGQRTWHEWGEGEEAPERYVCQLAQQMSVTGARMGYLCALVDGDLRVYQYTKDAELEGVLIDAVDAFWSRHVVPCIPPKADGSKTSAEYITQRFPRSTGRMVHADSSAEALMCNLHNARKAREKAERAEESFKQQLQEIIGENDGIESPRLGKILWRSTKDREVFDTKRLREEHPDLARRYTSMAYGYRSFRAYLKEGAK